MFFRIALMSREDVKEDLAFVLLEPNSYAAEGNGRDPRGSVSASDRTVNVLLRVLNQPIRKRGR